MGPAADGGPAQIRMKKVVAMKLEPRDRLCWRRSLRTTGSLLLAVKYARNMNRLDIDHGVGESRD